jgi:hypothetical protein
MQKINSLNGLKVEWEILTETTQRLMVFGGWIISRRVSKGHTWGQGASDAVALSLVFVPDPTHEWAITSVNEFSPEIEKEK